MEKINQRIENLEEKLNSTVVGSKEAMAIVDELDRMYQIKLRDEKAVDERSDRNRQFDLQRMRYEADILAAENERRHQLLGIAWDGVKLFGGGAIAVGSIVLIGAIEEKTILGQKMIGIAMKVFPKLF